MFSKREENVYSPKMVFFHIHQTNFFFYITDLVLRAARESWRRREREIMILFILSHPALGDWRVEGSELAQG